MGRETKVESKKGLQDRIVRLENVVQGIVDRLAKGGEVGEVSYVLFLPFAKDFQSSRSYPPNGL